MFPEKTRFLKRPKGWEDLTEVGYSWDSWERDTFRPVHSFCKSGLRVGRENGELFRFCPVCLVKVISK
jgi:hypothetical protein